MLLISETKRLCRLHDHGMSCISGVSEDREIFFGGRFRLEKSSTRGLQSSLSLLVGNDIMNSTSHSF